MMYLTLKNSEKTATVDDDIYHSLGHKNWSIQKNGYVISHDYLGKINGKYVSKTIYLHRLIMGSPEGLQVDHINGDKLFNLRSNLRICTNQQNNRNTKSRKGSSSKYKGVSWDARNKKWISQICIGNGTHKKIGRFVCEIEAAKAYDELAKKYHGEFAYLNFP